MNWRSWVLYCTSWTLYETISYTLTILFFQQASHTNPFVEFFVFNIFINKTAINFSNSFVVKTEASERAVLPSTSLPFTQNNASVGCATYINTPLIYPSLLVILRHHYIQLTHFKPLLHVSHTRNSNTTQPNHSIMGDSYDARTCRDVHTFHSWWGHADSRMSHNRFCPRRILETGEARAGHR